MQDNNIIQNAINYIKRLNKKYAELKAENERLKEELAGYGATGICETCTDKANIQADKYHQTLQKIKELAERQLLVTNVRTYQMVYYADFSEYRNEILQKITKAESEEV